MFLKSILENLPIGVFIQEAHDLRLIYWNKACEELLGYSREDVLGKNDYDFLPKKQAQYLQSQDRQVLAGGKLVDIPEVPIITPHRGKRLMHIKKVPLLDKAGTPRNLLSICEDITERKQSLEALRESEVHYRRIVETASEGVWVFDAHSKTTFANSRIAEMLGCTVEEMLGRSLFDFMDKESQKQAQAYVERRRQGIRERHDFQFRRKDGSDLWAIVSATPIEDAEGQFVGVLRMITDISDRKQAEKALRESEQRFRAIFDSMFQFIGLLKPDGTLLQANQTALEFGGLQLEDIAGHPFWETRWWSLSPQTQERLKAAIASAAAGEFVRYEVDVIGAGDRVITIDFSIKPVKDETGQVVLLIPEGRDISDKKQAEKALRDSEQRFRATFDQAAVGIAHVDLEGQFLRINQKFCDLLGYTQEEMLARTFQDITHPDDLEAHRRYLHQVLSGEIQTYSMEKRYIARNGEIVWVNFTVSLRRRSSGEPKYFIVVVQDISDRKLAEEALRQSEARFRNLVETTSDLVWEIDQHGVYTYVSPQIQDILGYSPEEVLGKSPFDFMLPEEAQRVRNLFDCFATHQQPLSNVKNTNIHKNGHRVILETSGIPFFDASGNFQGYRGIDRDITYRARAEEALRQSERQLRVKNQQLQQTLHQLKQTQAQLIQNEKMVSLGQMVAGIAHEINNPVSFIYGNITYADEYAQNLLNLVKLYNLHYPQPVPAIRNEIQDLDLEFLSDDFPKVLKSMQEGANRIREIVLSLRNFSRLDEAEIKQVNLHQGLDNTLLILQHRLKGGRGELAIQVSKEYGQLPLVECYPGPLNQVFMNLLTNAIDALETQAAPRIITIRTEVGTGNWGRVEESKSEKTGIISQQGSTGVQEQFSTPIPEGTTNFLPGLPAPPPPRQRNPFTPSSSPQFVVIRIADNGPGIPLKVKKRIFDPFFTTKPIGVGTGLGLWIAHSIIVEKHGGKLTCNSSPGQGAEFVIELPMRQH